MDALDNLRLLMKGDDKKKFPKPPVDKDANGIPDTGEGEGDEEQADSGFDQELADAYNGVTDQEDATTETGEAGQDTDEDGIPDDEDGDVDGDGEADGDATDEDADGDVDAADGDADDMPGMDAEDGLAAGKPAEGGGDIAGLVQRLATVEKDFYATRGMHGAGHAKSDIAMDTFHKMVRKLVRMIAKEKGIDPSGKTPPAGAEAKPNPFAKKDEKGDKPNPFAKKEEGAESGKPNPFAKKDGDAKANPFAKKDAADESDDSESGDEEQPKKNPFGKALKRTLSDLGPVARDILSKAFGLEGWPDNHDEDYNSDEPPSLVPGIADMAEPQNPGQFIAWEKLTGKMKAKGGVDIPGAPPGPVTGMNPPQPVPQPTTPADTGTPLRGKMKGKLKIERLDVETSKSDALDALHDLIKAGGVARGGKYISRKANGRGGYDYVYSHPETGKEHRISTREETVHGMRSAHPSITASTTHGGNMFHHARLTEKGLGKIRGYTSDFRPMRAADAKLAHDAIRDTHASKQSEAHESNKASDAAKAGTSEHVSKLLHAVEHGRTKKERAAAAKAAKATPEGSSALADKKSKWAEETGNSAGPFFHKVLHESAAKAHKHAAKMHTKAGNPGKAKSHGESAIQHAAQGSKIGSRIAEHKENGGSLLTTKSSPDALDLLKSFAGDLPKIATEKLMVGTKKKKKLKGKCSAMKSYDHTDSAGRPLRKGWYDFKNPPKDSASISNADLYGYLCAAIEEAYEHESAELAHRGVSVADLPAYFGRRVMNELIAAKKTNRDIARACAKYNVTAVTVVKVLLDSGLLHGGNDIESEGEDRFLVPAGEVRLALSRKAPSWVQADPFAAQGKATVSREPENVTKSIRDDRVDPTESYRLHRHREMNRLWNTTDGVVKSNYSASCTIHSRDISKATALSNPMARCTCNS